MWRLVVLGVCVAAIGGIFWRLSYLTNENSRLNGELNKANMTVAALDAAVTRQSALMDKERDLIDEIESAPDDDDGPVAPVLMRTISQLQNNGQ